VNLQNPNIEFRNVSVSQLPGVCVSLFYVIDTGSLGSRVQSPGAPPRDGLGVTYLPSTISSDAGYADLPLTLLGAPVDIGALLKHSHGLPGQNPVLRLLWLLTLGRIKVY
jgi:hypothetical protein